VERDTFKNFVLEYEVLVVVERDIIGETNEIDRYFCTCVFRTDSRQPVGNKKQTKKNLAKTLLLLLLLVSTEPPPNLITRHSAKKNLFFFIFTLL
jgi:hypothetical protein